MRTYPLNIKYISTSKLCASEHNARKHSQKQIDTLAEAIRNFGFNNPILIDDSQQVISGHARLLAAQQLNMAEVPTINLKHLNDTEVRAYRLADNRIAELAEWDEALLKVEFQTLLDLDFDMSLTGFDIPYIDLVIAGDEETIEEPVEQIDTSLSQITQQGDCWILGDHIVYCGNSLEKEAYETVLGNKKADLVFTDPPYNVAINGHVLTKGKHREFDMASGEMDQESFQGFLKTFIAHAVNSSREGSIHYICMDWRHIYDLLHVATPQYSELKNICVWNKTNGGMGSLYRSKHELITVFKNGTTPHINNVELGKHGRYRTNVWDYAGQNTFHKDRDEELALHPTVKPVQMVADAIQDCSKQGDIVLDPFGGSGSTLIATEKVSRKARLIELDGAYIDITIRRWEGLTGKRAVLRETGESFAQVAEKRKAVCFV